MGQRGRDKPTVAATRAPGDTFPFEQDNRPFGVLNRSLKR